ncbi:inositol monophosphatase [Jatrophihabitans telluris]|uniref:Inositol-1-monophosphatase n=1 Tax=Jatrophihabitans telluris TaxID=2038343 RepID=A0ABY4QUA7_9ACTN|nr:inositol monophosphatase family protein [Jatrophihabitans telluris]UQX86707.1 inositol monophosphatase [Jatrophihabitans telluris]
MNESSGPAPIMAEELRRIAVRLATKAGELVLAQRRAGFAVTTKSSATDVVTDVDRNSEQFLRAELARLRPGDAVLGEETGEVSGTDTGVRWVVDPIDGTVNFLLGLPQYAISIAAQIEGRTVAGCVHNPVSGDTFHAQLGGGAWLGHDRLSGPRSVPLAQAVVATGFGYDADYRARQGEIVGRLLGEIGNLRRLGSAALDLCALAAGWVDLYFEGPLGEWDFAAGLLIATEAGVSTSGLDGHPAGADFVAAGHPDAAPEFFAALQRLGAGTAARTFAGQRSGAL